MHKWLEIAWEQEGAGVEEIGGPQANKSIVAYFHRIGRPEIVSDEVPWCAAFDFDCLQKAGIDLSPVSKADRLLAISALKIGTRIAEPRVGCNCVMKLEGGHHVGFVTKWTATTITLLGGNQANKVCERTFKRTADMVFMWPGSVTQADVDDVSRIAKAAKQVQADTIKTPAAQVIGNGVPAAHVDPSSLPSHEVMAKSATALQHSFDIAIQFAAFCGQRLPWIAAILGAYWLARIAWNSRLIRQWRHEDAATGKAPITADYPAADANDLLEAA